MMLSACSRVKKKLKILSEHDIIRCTGINPKFWKFDEYNYQRLDEEDEIYQLLCSFDDVLNVHVDI